MANIESINKSRISDNEDGIRRSFPKGGVDGTNSRFALDVINTFDELLSLMLLKHEDYGSKNISDSPGGAINGLRVRMHDKLARINNLHGTHLAAIMADVQPNFEPLEDSFKDMANYAIIGLLVLRGQWDN